MPHYQLVIINAIFVYSLNIPFGMWRENSRKFSLAWITAIHLPVLMIIGFRFLIGLNFEWITFPIFVLCFFLGQLTGAIIVRRKKKKNQPVK